ncbi:MULTISPECIES: DUF3999 domain-containing protein [unclassified Acidovorax]|uniref:DUF3999 domain-containing protein n=1 Tax=unclassified Acidovorax TaxID=2684926 RepID=UPI001C48E0EB|nr:MULTISPECIES: DUF3999 domain-containing protein [unclassified Acidovorax]MBV7461418.1 DUF3999 domain-containing protein [Acidovorax sp. sif0632]MBV7466478.1 DUF3999 domain-containing protein [Acidovorax sp. sif0613]
MKKPVALNLPLVLAAAALSLCTGVAQAAADANSPAAYAIRVPVTLAADAPLQRVMLPAEVLVRLQSPGYADVRLFNGAGQPVPIALAGVAAASAPEELVTLPAYPILGAASTGTAGLEGLSLRIEERQGQRVVQIDTAATAGTTPQAVRGALLDARNVQLPVARMALDVDLPAGQPVTFRVQTSKDLKHWQPLAETVLYRADAAAAPTAPGRLGNEQIDLQRAGLKGHYLRVTWGDAAVTLRGATLATSRSTGPRERVSASMATPALANPRELVFALPFATPVAALAITPPGSNVLIPVRVLGRNHREQPWSPLASAVVYKMATGGKEQASGPVELGGASVREIKIEADPKTPGFAAAPALALQFEPAQLVFLASGQGPFTLAAGLSGATAAASAFLPLASLVPGYQPAQENQLPVALADVARADITGGQPADGAQVPAAAASGGISTRSAVLWGVLLAGVAALGLMAWLLLRQTKQAGHQAPAAPTDAA